MVWEIVLPMAGASIPLAVYVWKKDMEKKKELEEVYKPLLDRTDLKPSALEHYMFEMDCIKGGIGTYLKKRELKQKIAEKINNLNKLE